jgi:hypothetical protein
MTVTVLSMRVVVAHPGRSAVVLARDVTRQKVCAVLSDLSAKWFVTSRPPFCTCVYANVRERVEDEGEEGEEREGGVGIATRDRCTFGMPTGSIA